MKLGEASRGYLAPSAVERDTFVNRPATVTDYVSFSLEFNVKSNDKLTIDFYKRIQSIPIPHYCSSSRCNLNKMTIKSLTRDLYHLGNAVVEVIGCCKCLI